MLKPICTGTGNKAPQVKVLASNPDNMGSILGTRMAEEEKTDSCRLSFDLHKCAVYIPYTEIKNYVHRHTIP